MTPRDIIARQIPGSRAETCFGIADAILEQLAAAGYVILPTAEEAQAIRDKAREEAVEEIEANWGHVATPEMRDAIRALKGAKP